MKRVTLICLLLLIPCICAAGDFLTLDRAPKPDKLNADGIPVYLSYWEEGKGIPDKCTEAIGEEGAQLYAERIGWKKLLTAPDKGKSRQGFDQIWEDEKTGKVIVVEAKGRVCYSAIGNSLEMKRSHGFYKPATEWCIEICKSEMRSKQATAKSKEAAALVLQKISEGKLESRLIVTSHSHGIPFMTRTESAVLTVPKEYRNKTPDELIGLTLDEIGTPQEYEPDPDLIRYEFEPDQMKYYPPETYPEEDEEEDDLEDLFPYE